MGDRLETLLASLAGSFQASRAKITVSPVVTTTSQKIISANPERIGLIIYNNSSNTGYIAFGSTANSANNMTRPITTFAAWDSPLPVFTGEIYAIRNAGTGTFIITELLK